MTLTKNYKEYEFCGNRYFVEMYKDLPSISWFYRYGYIVKFGTVDVRYKLKDGLLTRPNLKKLFGN